MELFLAFYKGKGSLFTRLIRWWTSSRFSHVELVRFELDGSVTMWSSSEQDGGTRRKNAVLTPEHWEILSVQIPRPEKALEWAEWNLGKKYDWLGIFGFVWRPAKEDRGRYFCSEFCLSALQAGGFGIGLKAHKVDPQGLYEFVVEGGR